MNVRHTIRVSAVVAGLSLFATSCASTVIHMDPGTCFDGGSANLQEVTAVDPVDCAQPHDNETVGSFDLPDGEFPGSGTVSNHARDGCIERFEPYVGSAYDESIYILGWLGPTNDSWAIGDREVICYVFGPAGPITGSVRGRTA